MTEQLPWLHASPVTLLTLLQGLCMNWVIDFETTLTSSFSDKSLMSLVACIRSANFLCLYLAYFVFICQFQNNAQNAETPLTHPFPLNIHFKTLNMMWPQSAIHTQPLSGSADEASCICEYQLWQLLVFAHTLVLVPSHLPLPTWLRSTQTPSKKWHECVHNTGYITVYMDWVGDVAQIGVKLMVMAQMCIT